MKRKTVYMPLSEIVPADRNAKRHADDNIRASFRRFDLIDQPALDERTGKLIAGHGRIENLTAMKDAGERAPEGVTVRGDGEWMVPVQRGWASKDDLEAEAAGIELNRSTELGGWDIETLSVQLDEIKHSSLGLEGLGFSSADIDGMLAQLEHQRDADDAGDAEPEHELLRPPSKPKTRKGDVWQLGPHALVCGDCRDGDIVRLALDGRPVNVGFTSPPYASQRDYDEASGFKPIPEDEYVEWFAPVAANVGDVLADDGSWFVNIKPSANGLDTSLYVLDLVVAHVRKWGWHFATEFCWERNGVPKHVTRRFKNQFEPIYQFTRGDWKIRADNVRFASENAVVAIGRTDSEADWSTIQGAGVPLFKDEQKVARRTAAAGNMSAVQGLARPKKNPVGGIGEDVQGTGGPQGIGEFTGLGFAYPGNRLPTFAGTHEAVGHSAAFPVGLAAFFVRAYADEGDVIFDPFLGSGSTLLAAHEHDRVCVGIEISPAYCDVICARFQRRTGIVPVRRGKPVEFS